MNNQRKEITEKLQGIICDTVDNDELIINESTVATDIDGWDSLAQVLIIGELQKAYDIKLKSSEISDIANVGQLIDLIIEKINK